MGSHFLLLGIFPTHWLNSSPALAVRFLTAEAPGKLGCWKSFGKSRVSILKKKGGGQEKKKNSRNRHSFKCPCERQQRPKTKSRAARLGVRCYTLMKHQNPAGSVTVKLGKLQPGEGLQISLSSQPFDPPLKPLSKMAWSSPSPKNTLLSLSVFLYVSVSTQTLPLGTCVSTAGISEVETWLQSTTQVGGMQTHQVGAVPLSAAPVHMLPPQLHSAHHTPFSYSAGIGSPQFISRSPPTVHLKIYFNSKLIFLEQCSSWGRGF